MSNAVKWGELERLMHLGLEAMREGDMDALRQIIAEEKPTLRALLGGEFDDVIDWGDEREH